MMTFALHCVVVVLLMLCNIEVLAYRADEPLSSKLSTLVIVAGARQHCVM